MRAAIYARVSTVDRQDTLNQLEQLRRYAQAHGWEAREFVDHATGKNDKRPQFAALFQSASRREIDVVLVWALDRFSREGVAKTFQHIQQLNEYGVKFESYSEPHFRTTGAAGQLMIAIAAWIAEQERIRIVERINAGLDRVRKYGSKSGNPMGRPFCIFNREEAWELRQAGWSYMRIGKHYGIADQTARRALLAYQQISRKASPLQ